MKLTCKSNPRFLEKKYYVSIVVDHGDSNKSLWGFTCEGNMNLEPGNIGWDCGECANCLFKKSVEALLSDNCKGGFEVNRHVIIFDEETDALMFSLRHS